MVREPPDAAPKATKPRRTGLLWLVISLAAVFSIAGYAFQAWVPVVLKALQNIQTFSAPLLYSYAFFAGALVFASPCAIGILPAYLTFYLKRADETEGGSAEKLKRGLRWGSLAGLGAVIAYIPILLTLYSIPSLVIGAPTGFSTTASYLVLSAWSKPIILAILVTFGVLLLTNYSFSTNRFLLLLKRLLGFKGGPKEGVVGFGLLYGVGSYGCGMLVIVPLVMFNLLEGIVLKGLISFLFFLAGFFSMVLFVTTLVTLSKTQAIHTFVVYTLWVKRLAGVVVLLATAWLVNFYIKTGGM